MSDAAQTALIAMVGTVLLSVVAGVLKLFADAREARRDAADKAQTLADQNAMLHQIKLLVNSRLDTALADLATLKDAVGTLVPKQQRLVEQAVSDATAAGVSTVLPEKV